MRLRTRLALTYALMALVPLAVVVPSTLANLRQTLRTEAEARTSQARGAVETALTQEGVDLVRSLETLARGEELEGVARSLLGHGAPPRMADLGAMLMRSRGLTALALLDARGVTLTSGHLPARLGDVDAELLALSRGPPGALPVLLEVRTSEGPARVPALLAARPVDYGSLRLWLVGGKLLDGSVAARLAKLSGSAIRIEPLAPGIAAVQAGEIQAPFSEQVLSLGDVARLHVRQSLAAARRAELGVLRAFLVLALAALALAVAVGLFVSRRITRPVEALTEGVRRLGAGERARVEVTASGELAVLVSSFNRMQEDLERTTAQLLASERVAAWQEVARRLAHELKNPLTPIRMTLETLQAAHAEGNPRFQALFKESAGMVLEEVDRLRRIIDEFSRFARLPAPELQSLELTALIQSVLSLFSSPRPGVVPQATLAGPLPIRGDRDQLTQVLLNLLKNAAEALPREGGDIWVRAHASTAGAVIEIEDSGPGIPVPLRARVLEPYFTRKEGGTGLGLPIAARICEEHGGRLEVLGAEGAGATLRITLPR